jgi:hypothetical protein
MLVRCGFACAPHAKLAPEDMLDRDREADDLLALAEGGHSFRLVGPRRYGKTTLLRRVLESAEREGVAAILVDLQDVLSIAEIAVRIERAYERLKGPVRRHVENVFRTWNIGLSLGGGGFTASLQRNPHVDAESVLLRLLDSQCHPAPDRARDLRVRRLSPRRDAATLRGPQATAA